MQTYFWYKLRYGDMLEEFEKNNFDHKIVSPKADWPKIQKFSDG